MLTGELFIAEGLINEEQLQAALLKQQELGGSEPLAQILLMLGFIEERDKVRCTGKIWGIPFVDVLSTEPEPEALAKIQPEHAKKFRVLPFELTSNRLLVAMVNPLDIFVIDELRVIAGIDIEPMIAVESDLVQSIINHYKLESVVNEKVSGVISDFNSDLEAKGESLAAAAKDDDEDDSDDAPIVRLANLIVSQAVTEGASDIHMEPKKDSMVVRYRIDGVLIDVMHLPKKVVLPLTSRMKIIANMDIAEKRVPQDNRISSTVNGKPYDFRVSTLPVVYGEKIVMRVLDKSGINVGLDKLGFLPDNLALLEDMASRSYGILLVTGPTGSGKSTTLYSLVNKINTGMTNITTIEDPVEYELAGINQCAVNVRAGMTFAKGLKAMMRQDPDIIMIGEMRDNETATIAMEAALTGHLVLSTLHTNDAPSAPTRLIDMEVEPFLISSSIIGVLAQRLVRRICPSCRVGVETPTESLMRYGFPLPDGIPDTVTLYHGEGCDKCKKSGYKGRTGVHELMAVTDDIRDEILRRSPSHILRRLGMQNGMKTLQMDAVAKVLLGVTTVDEVLRVLYA